MPMSIRLRLTLLYSAILALTLILFGVALYGVIYGVTFSAAKDTLKADTTNLATWLHNYGDPLAQSPPPLAQTFFEISNLDGRVLLQSSNLQGKTLPLDPSVLAQIQTTGTAPDPGVVTVGGQQLLL